MEKFHFSNIELKPYYIKPFMPLISSCTFSFWRVKTIFITLTIIAGLSTSVFGQIKAAKAEMAQLNYPKAIEILHQFIQKADPKTKLEATLLMADCYRLDNDMQDARSWYFKAIKMGNNDPLTYFYYGKALRACGEYETAKEIFLRYDSLMPEDHRGKIYASFCDSAMAWDEKPFAFEVNNARNLNSANNEFGPVFYNRGVVFTTDKPMTTEDEKKSGWKGHGYLKLVFADPKQKDDFYGEYNLPRLIPELYTNGSNDGPATFSKDGNEVFITRTIKATEKTNDESEEGQSNQLKIFSATKTGDKWSKLKPFFFNSNHYSVGYPALSPDGNSLYFASDVEGGYGGLDLYVSTRDGGNWSQPENLGPIVNTFGDETFPFMADNGNLYFASDGHPGYGGLDIFVTRKVGNVWLNPQNLGRPINSSYDDFALAMYNNDSVGLFSANRPGGRGEDDIYTFRVVGPLPVLTSQPPIAAAQNPVPQKEIKPVITEEQKVTPPPAENVVPVPAPVTAEVTPPVQKQEITSQPNVAPQEEVKPAVTEEQKVTPTPVEEQKVQPSPAENVVPAPAPVTAEVTPPAQKQEVTPQPKVTPREEVKPAVTEEQKVPPAPAAEQQVSPTPAQNVVPAPAPVTAEVTPPAQKQEVPLQPKVTPQEEVKPAVIEEQKVPPAPAAEQQVSPTPAENVVPAPTPVTAEVTPPAQKQEVPPQPKVTPQEEVKPAVTEEQKVPPAPVAEQQVSPTPAENVVSAPTPVTAEVTPPAQKQEVPPQPKVTPQEEVKPAVTEEQKVTPSPVEEQKVQPAPTENVVPAQAAVTEEVPPQAQKQEVTPQPKVTPQEEIKPAVTEEQKVQPAPAAEQKVSPTPAENVVPVPAPVTEEITPPAQKQEVPPQPKVPPQEEVKPAVTEEQKVTSAPVAEQKVQPAPAENVVPVPAPVTTEVTPPVQKQEITPHPNVTSQQEIQPAVTTITTNPKIMVTGCIKDGTTREAIPAATVFFLNENSGQVFVHKANETGCFKSELLAGINYRIKAMQTGYSSDCIPFFSSISSNQTETVISNDLLLEKIGAIHTYRVDNIYYDFDRYFIRPDAEPNLNKLVQIMNENPVTVELAAHADCRGPAAYNMILTKKRAASAAHYIIQKGIDGTRVTSHWYGKSRLTNNCNCAKGVYCTRAQHQANRRCEFTISLPALTMEGSVIDLEKFHEGDSLDIRLLPPDFFNNCAHRILSGPLAELLDSSTLLSSEQNSLVFYTVQIGAFSYLKPHFNNLNDVMSCKGSDGILRCFVGKFSSKEEAIWFRDHLRSRDFKDAFVAELDEKHNPGASNQTAYLSKK
jgi:outer membrane protein OmpA-like peptidoglycan-associated protein/tetratricopeptide (TPR) repeat protein